MRFKLFALALAACLFNTSVFAADAQYADPQQVVKETANKVLAEVTLNKTNLEQNPKLIYPLVERLIVPYFDFKAMAQSAMGRFWRNSSDEQQARLVNEFKELLVGTYATALLGYSGQEIEYPPMNMEAGSDRAMVPTKIAAAGGPPIPVNYRLKLRDNGWMVTDVVIDGISLVTTYRSSFAREIQMGAAKSKGKDRMALGIDALIQTLADKNNSK